MLCILRMRESNKCFICWAPGKKQLQSITPETSADCAIQDFKTDCRAHLGAQWQGVSGSYCSGCIVRIRTKKTNILTSGANVFFQSGVYVRFWLHSWDFHCHTENLKKTQVGVKFPVFRLQDLQLFLLIDLRAGGSGCIICVLTRPLTWFPSTTPIS